MATRSSGFEIRNLTAVRRALADFARDLDDLKSEGIASAVAPAVTEARGRAQGGGPQARRAASGLRIEKGRTPRVTWSGSSVVVSGGGTITGIAGGVEYGGPSFFPNGGRRFPVAHDPDGRFLLPTLTSRADTITRAVQTNVVGAWNTSTRRTR